MNSSTILVFPKNLFIFLLVIGFIVFNQNRAHASQFRDDCSLEASTGKAQFIAEVKIIGVEHLKVAGEIYTNVTFKVMAPPLKGSIENGSSEFQLHFYGGKLNTGEWVNVAGHHQFQLNEEGLLFVGDINDDYSLVGCMGFLPRESASEFKLENRTLSSSEVVDQVNNEIQKGSRSKFQSISAKHSWKHKAPHRTVPFRLKKTGGIQ